MKIIISILLLTLTIISNQVLAQRKIDEKTAARILECLNKNFISCTKVGMFYRFKGDDDTHEDDLFKAVDFFKMACNGRESTGCYFLGVMYEQGEGVRLDSPYALQLYGKSCDLRDELGCRGYAALKRKGVK